MALPVQHLNDRFEGEFTFRGKKYGVPFTLPGDHVQFQIERKGRKRQSMKVVKIERAESYPEDLPLVEPVCAVHGRCGGCRAQHLEYGFQLDLKTNPIREAMVSRFEVTPEIRPAPALENYRGRMDFVVDGSSVGLRPAGDFASFVDIDRCPVQSANANELLNVFRTTLARYPGVAFERATGSGVVKYVTIRSGDEDPVAVLTINAGGSEDPDYQRFRDELRGLMALVETTTDAAAEVSCPPGGRTLAGDGALSMSLGGRSFRVPYDAFFQPNPRAFDVLLDWCFAALDDVFREGDAQAGVSATSEPGTLMDLFSGMGVLSALAVDRYPRRFASVRGFDFTASAVERAPALFPDHIPTKFVEADLGKPPADLFESNPATDLILIDPPRAGLAPALSKLLTLSAPSPLILYISCNPRSQLQDLSVLAERYRPLKACIVDCFPFTPHLEQAVLLERRT